MGLHFFQADTPPPSLGRNHWQKWNLSGFSKVRKTEQNKRNWGVWPHPFGWGCEEFEEMKCTWVKGI